MSTDFRALCAELTDVILAELPFGTCEELVIRARAALAADGPAVQSREPASVVGEPSDEELLEEGPSLEDVEELCEEHCFNVEGYESIECLQGLINDALARWGHPALVPAEGEVAELVAKLKRLAPQNPLGIADPTITRAADLLERHPEPVPVPKGPTRDDLWELWLRLNNELPDRPAAVVEFWEHAQIDARARAADLLEQRHLTPAETEA